MTRMIIADLSLWYQISNKPVDCGGLLLSDCLASKWLSRSGSLFLGITLGDLEYFRLFLEAFFLAGISLMVGPDKRAFLDFLRSSCNLSAAEQTMAVVARR